MSFIIHKLRVVDVPDRVIRFEDAVINLGLLTYR